MTSEQKLNSEERVYLFCRANHFYPVMLPEATLHDNITGNPGTLAVLDAMTNSAIWTQADGYLDSRYAEMAGGTA